MNLLCEGLTVPQIATHLSRDENAIYDRLGRAQDRLGVDNIQQLVPRVISLRNGSTEQ